MIIDFSATNFRSINERQTFSLQTVSRIAEMPENVIENTNTRLLRSVVIYGRNASGKSNLCGAMDCLLTLATNENNVLMLGYRPFKISINKPDKPIIFEINFYAANKKRYFYEISFTAEKIIMENLFHYPEGKKARLFLRNQEILTTEISFLKDMFHNIYPYHTILSRLNHYKIDALLPVFEFFSRHFLTRVGLNEIADSYNEIKKGGILNKEKEMPYHMENLGKLIKIADTGIDSIIIKQLDYNDFDFPEDFGENLKQQMFNANKIKVIMKHPFYKNGNISGFIDFEYDEESAGTKKLFLFGSKMFDALSNGDVLIVDELDKGLHPKLMQAIIGIFNNPKTNPNNAQLIFTTHDVSLLSSNIFRRDQIYITEKNIKGETSIYTLADIKGVRADIAFEKYLMNGVFGGVPVINEYDFDFNLKRKDEKE